MHDLVTGLNEVLQSEEPNMTADGMDLREKVIQARNFLINEKTDLDDFISMAQVKIKQVPKNEVPVS
jgi:hypothetical protein